MINDKVVCSFIGVFFCVLNCYGQKSITKTSDLKEDSIIVLPPVFAEPINPFYNGELKFSSSPKLAVNEHSNTIEINKVPAKIDSSFNAPNVEKKQTGNTPQLEPPKNKEIEISKPVNKIN